MRICGIVKYNGTKYNGWAKQLNAQTIQGVIEDKLSSYLGNTEVNIYGSGRTDAGVAANHQYFHFDVNNDKLTEDDLDRMRYSVNKMLPDDIHLLTLKKVADDFHARFSAKGKQYIYTISLNEKDVFDKDVVYPCPYNLDLELMKEALTHFNGEHCFKNFTSKEEDEKNFVRNITETKFEIKDDKVLISFKGDGFMRYMVRYMVGMIIEIGRGKATIDELDSLLKDTKERTIISYKAPANGLMLLEVFY